MNEIINIFGNFKGKINRKEFLTGLFLLSGLFIIPKLLLLTGILVKGNLTLIINYGLIFFSIFIGYILCSKRFHDLGKNGYNALLVMIPFFGYFILLYLLLTKGNKSIISNKLIKKDYILIITYIIINALLYIGIYNHYYLANLNKINEIRDDIRLDNTIKIGTIITDYYYYNNYKYPNYKEAKKILGNHNFNDPWFGKTVNGCTFGYLYEVNETYSDYRVSACLGSKKKQEWYARTDLSHIEYFKNKTVRGDYTEGIEKFKAIDKGFLDLVDISK